MVTWTIILMITGVIKWCVAMFYRQGAKLLTPPWHCVDSVFNAQMRFCGTVLIEQISHWLVVDTVMVLSHCLSAAVLNVKTKLWEINTLIYKWHFADVWPSAREEISAPPQELVGIQLKDFKHLLLRIKSVSDSQWKHVLTCPWPQLMRPFC